MVNRPLELEEDWRPHRLPSGLRDVQLFYAPEVQLAPKQRWGHVPRFFVGHHLRGGNEHFVYAPTLLFYHNANPS